MGFLKKGWNIIPQALVLFVLWVVFTSRLNWEHLLMGAVVSVLVALLAFRVLGGGLDPGLGWRFALRFPLFSALILVEIIKANWDVLKRIFAPGLPISPRIVWFDSYLESELARTILANSITLTPGTVTVDIRGRRFFIHCLSADQVDDPGDGRLQRMTAWLTGEGPVDNRRLK